MSYDGFHHKNEIQTVRGSIIYYWGRAGKGASRNWGRRGGGRGRGGRGAKQVLALFKRIRTRKQACTRTHAYSNMQTNMNAHARTHANANANANSHAHTLAAI
jgi:hypothetical protein